MKWKIGDVEIDNQVVLAPMAGVCNSAFRTIIKEMGCGLVYAEMVSDKAIVYENVKTKDMLYMTEFERPITQQIFGSDKESFVKAAKIIYNEMKPDIIDINMGCPVPKVAVRAQAGSALLKNPEKIYDIVKSVVESVPIPVTVKIRSGWDNSTINAVEVAKICESAGASAICIHPRTRAQGYSGNANWEIIKEIKKNVSIPVIGNGDIKNAIDAKRMLDETNCDAVMIGRAVLGNPWLIKEIICNLEGKEFDEVTNREKLLMCKKHFEYLLKIKSEKLALLEIRSHTAWYVKKMTHSNVIKLSVYNAKTKENFLQLIDGYLQQM